MCNVCAEQAKHALPARRAFLKTAACAAASLSVASLAIAPQAFAAGPKAPPKPENALTPDTALKRLLDGNARYIAGTTQRYDFRHEREALSGGQNPFAAILSCADSRIAPEFC